MAQQTSSTPHSDVLPSEKKRARLRKIRRFKDGFSFFGVGFGGLGVIFSLALIFLYLFYETFPLLKPVSMNVGTELSVPASGDPSPTMHMVVDRYEELGARFAQSGAINFFNVADGSLTDRISVTIPEGESVSSFGRSESRKRLFVYGFTDGSLMPVKLDYDITYPGGERHVKPKLTFPLGEEPIRLGGDLERRSFSALHIVDGRGGYAIAAGNEQGEIGLALFETRRNMLLGTVEINRQDYTLPSIGEPIRQILVDDALRNLIAIDRQGKLYHFSIVDRANPELIDVLQVVDDGEQVTAASFLVGARSLIVGGSDGSVRQWMFVRDDQTNKFHLTYIRSFERQPGAITFIEPEYSRKGFITGDDQGQVALHYGTSNVTLKSVQLESNAPINRIAISPINGLALVKQAGRDEILPLHIDNPHPQTTLSSLWGKVWYEGSSEPDFVWQSSSADDAFESKFSLVPLSVGTLKAAFFAMLLATPLAIMGAIYTAYFMAPTMRKVVKPSIELMEALPTVILGFLAGIWLAPYIENHLPLVFTSLILIPVGMVLAGFAWKNLPEGIRHRVPAGWEALLLVPVVILLGWFAVASSPWIELALFDGSMRQWLTDVGIPFDQRNALIVGIAMGFAVIPTIFSIAEDAIYSVPKHLTQGSLALGATPWQTMTKVVLLTASPGIFSAVMIGFGRAVGETMIVLMASGNSPIVNFNIFEGMRTLAANIAVELPETAVGSTHFRVLFLSALVLLVFTFLLNTLAEVVRQRLRKRYASL
ncbi:MAG TPA: ABC transporter permease subunit [Halothiobacillaceae bacterium]|nr:ABC transporter permease subunit [Halothiobacillaceae bacterium]